MEAGREVASEGAGGGGEVVDINEPMHLISTPPTHSPRPTPKRSEP